MIAVKGATAAHFAGRLLGALAEVEFDANLHTARAWQAGGAETETGGQWVIDAASNQAVLNAFVRNSRGDESWFHISFDLAKHREALKAAGHTGQVILIEDARGGKPTKGELLAEAIMIGHVPAEPLAIALAPPS